MSGQQYVPAQTMPAPSPETTYASSSKPWGKPDIGAFLRGCAELTPFDGRNWGKYKFDFGLHNKSYGVKGFIDIPAPWGPGHAHPPAGDPLFNDYQQMSTAVFTGIYNSCSEVMKYKIKGCAETPYPASEAWQLLNHDHTSEKTMNASHLLYQLEIGKLKPGEAEQYLAEKLRLREGLFTMNHPLSTISFNHYLLEGLP